MNLNDALNTFLAQAKDAGCQKLIVAYSGGVDSHVLLHALHALPSKIPIEAIYINHQLQAEAASWAKHCASVCQKLNIPFQQITVNAQPTAGESPEEKARTARYEAFARVLMKDHWMLTAQHQDDQAETLLLQLLRGSGVEGLSAMPQSRSLGFGKHLRPLLSVSKQAIRCYADEHQLVWIDDPSNQDKTIPRNYLRHSIMPSFYNFWPETNRLLNRSASWLSEASEIISEVAEQDLRCCSDIQQSININKLQRLSFNRQKNLLRHWFHQYGLKRPGSRKLTIIFEQIIAARLDANPQLEWQNISLRRYRNNLYLQPIWPVIPDDWTDEWDVKSSVTLPDNWAKIEAVEVVGSGLNQQKIKLPLTLRIRQGGEKCQPVGRSSNRSVKKLFQEYSVAPWLRDRWPLLYSEENLIAVPGLFICDGYQSIDDEKGLAVDLHINQDLNI